MRRAFTQKLTQLSPVCGKTRRDTGVLLAQTRWPMYVTSPHRVFDKPSWRTPHRCVVADISELVARFEKLVRVFRGAATTQNLVSGIHVPGDTLHQPVANLAFERPPTSPTVRHRWRRIRPDHFR
ncbi:Uncharacterised protein [Mycobacteroides abscessus subsp. massiliense]|uniref:Uncharacterized protein n=1 Tax=Mycobacteroides abscessus subsp. massiliense TaxID=1962118 RepID=A0A1T8VBU1_9MYCO|nr:Uncharacterised protein [Mycobacteroides abscessus subsp. massiliense]